MTTAALDYRFGWRWLLPVGAGVQLRLCGFAADEALFWQRWVVGLLSAAPSAPAGSAPGARLLLVDAGRCRAGEQPTAAELAQADVVAVLADRAQGGHWRRTLQGALASVREYALLPAANPRVVVPLSAPRHALAGLGLHRPGRWVARVGIGLARTLAAGGHCGLLRGRVLLIAARNPQACAVGARQAGLQRAPDGQPWQAFALYLGTADDKRKTVVLPLSSGPPRVILKAGSSPQARAALGQEAEALLALAASPVAGQVPRLLGQVASAEALTLQQEYRPRRRVPQAGMETAVVRFLGCLAGLSRQGVALAEVLPTALTHDGPGAAAAPAARAAVRARLGQLATAGEMVWLHRTHGDFAPWNCAATDQGLFVYDWEDSREHGLALSDAFYYAVAPALLVQRRPQAAATLAAALHLAGRVLAASPGALDVRLYLALWLLARVGKAALYDELLIELERSWPCARA